MREINRAFAIKMLEIQTGKSEEEMRNEATREIPDWPGGGYELEQSIAGHERFAKTVLAHYDDQEPAAISKSDVLEIFSKNSGMRVSDMSDSEVDRFRQIIGLVFRLWKDME